MLLCNEPLVPAVLYGVQKLIGVIAVTSKTWFQLALQSSTAAVGMLRVLGNVAVHLPMSSLQCCMKPKNP